jgi:hypothetical protein
MARPGRQASAETPRSNELIWPQDQVAPRAAVGSSDLGQVVIWRLIRQQACVDHPAFAATNKIKVIE